MDDNMSFDVVLNFPDEYDQIEVYRAANQLREELLDLDIESVEFNKSDIVEEGARGIVQSPL